MSNDQDWKRKFEAIYSQPFIPENIQNVSGNADHLIKLRQLAALEYMAAQLGVIARHLSKPGKG